MFALGIKSCVPFISMIRRLCRIVEIALHLHHSCFCYHGRHRRPKGNTCDTTSAIDTMSCKYRKSCDTGKRYPEKLINFVRMKKSLNYLPVHKRRDLRQLVALIREEVPEVVMVILYGSYARGTYVDYDQRIEYGVKTYFMSDYDLLLVTERRMGNDEQTAYARILRRFYTNRAWEISTRPQFINESIGELNKALDKSRYFYTDIKREGVMLYDSGKYTLARRRRLDFAEIGEMAKEYFEDKFPFANRFFENSKRDVLDRELRMSVFNLHQAAENYLRTIPMVFTLYGYKEHDLASLMNQCKKHTLEIYRAFPQDTDEECRLFKLLQDAYVQARYNKHFAVTKEDIDALLPKVELLKQLVGKVCRERIAYYDSRIGRA